MIIIIKIVFCTLQYITYMYIHIHTHIHIHIHAESNKLTIYCMHWYNKRYWFWSDQSSVGHVNYCYHCCSYFKRLFNVFSCFFFFASHMNASNMIHNEWVTNKQINKSLKSLKKIKNFFKIKKFFFLFFFVIVLWRILLVINLYLFFFLDLKHFFRPSIQSTEIMFSKRDKYRCKSTRIPQRMKSF